MFGGIYPGEAAPGQIQTIVGSDPVAFGNSAWVFGGFYFAEVGGLPSPPRATLVSESRTKISRVSGYDSSAVTWKSDLDFISYQFRIVTSSSDPVSAGVQIEQDQSPSSGGTANTNYSSTLTDAEVEAVSSAEGTKLVKLFLQNSCGWSS